MKTLLSIVGVLAIALNTFATGAYQIDSPQNGVVTFTGTNQSQTITFAPGFSRVPVMQVFGSSTNASPITNSVTSTNFTISVASTNLSVAWNAYLGYPRLQKGTVVSGGGTNVTVTFATPYAYAPVVSVDGSSTNASSITGLGSVTATNFTILSGANTTNQWQAIGEAYAPGLQTVTY